MAERNILTREEDWEVGDELTKRGRELLADLSQFFETRESFKPGKKGKFDKEGRLIEPPEPGERVITVALKAEAMLAALKLGSELKTKAIGADAGPEVEGADAVLPPAKQPVDLVREVADLLDELYDRWERKQAGDGSPDAGEAGALAGELESEPTS